MISETNWSDFHEKRTHSTVKISPLSESYNCIINYMNTISGCNSKYKQPDDFNFFFRLFFPQIVLKINNRLWFYHRLENRKGLAHSLDHDTAESLVSVSSLISDKPQIKPLQFLFDCRFRLINWRYYCFISWYFGFKKSKPERLEINSGEGNL